MKEDIIKEDNSHGWIGFAWSAWSTHIADNIPMYLGARWKDEMSTRSPFVGMRIQYSTRGHGQGVHEIDFIVYEVHDILRPGQVHHLRLAANSRDICWNSITHFTKPTAREQRPGGKGQLPRITNKLTKSISKC